MENEIFIQKEDTHIRLDKFLVKILNETRNYVTQLIDQKLVLINQNVISKHGYLVQKNDEITILFAQLIQQRRNTKKMVSSSLEIQFRVLYEDTYLMVIYKPKHLLCHATSFGEKNTLVDQLIQYNQKNFLPEDLKALRAGLLHRLDRDTSGLLLVAKNREVFYKLKQDLEKRIVKRYYYALVDNNFSTDKNLVFSINLPIDHDYNSTKMRIAKTGKEAITKVVVLKNFVHHAFIECELFTGRTHQIRVHLKAIHHPIYNDPLYNYKINSDGQYLSAHKIEFIHPITHEKLKFDIGIENYLQQKIEEFKHEK